MKSTHLMLLAAPIAMVAFLSSSVLLAQEAKGKYVNPYRAAQVELSVAVATARVMSESVRRDPTTGASLTMQRIAPPAFSPLPVPDGVAEPRPPLSAEALTARRAALPTMQRLFSPTVVVYPGGISLVKWWNLDPLKGSAEWEAWVATDLESIWACGDFTVGKCRYLMMANRFYSTDRAVGARKAPALADFQGRENVILVKGDAKDTAALVPLMALLDKYVVDGDSIRKNYLQQRALAKEQADWEGLLHSSV